MRRPIPGLVGTPTHAVAVELFQGHHGGAAGVCVRCGEREPCPVRLHAALVIVAAGEDPRWYDGRLAPGAAAADPAGPWQRGRPGQSDVGEPYADHTGFRVGGRDVRTNPAGFLYERDQ